MDDAPSRHVDELRKQISELQQQLASVQRGDRHEPIENYTFDTPGNETVTLLELFGDQRDLIVVHNMGMNCPYCTLWADGFNGVLAHLESRAAFALASPDATVDQQSFALQRGWRFRMVSTAHTNFTRALGFENEDGEQLAGLSAFTRTEDDRIIRTGAAEFGPGDSFCPVWHCFGLLQDGAAGWSPKLQYPAQPPAAS